METYPRYARRYLKKAGRVLIREDLSSGHIRYYFPDLCGHLRLVLINDHTHREKRVLDPQVLAQAFGVTPEELFILPTPCYLAENFVTADTLDHLNTWPVAVYPGGRQAADVSSTPVAELPFRSRPDAWI